MIKKLSPVLLLVIFTFLFPGCQSIQEVPTVQKGDLVLFETDFSCKSGYCNQMNYEVKDPTSAIIVIGYVDIDKGELTLKITDPNGKVVFNETYTEQNSGKIDEKFESIAGKWNFKFYADQYIKGDYQLIGKVELNQK